MTSRVSAVYEHGTLRLSEPMPIADGTPVEVIVVTQTEDTGRQRPSEILSRIAAMPIEPGGRNIAGKDHDDALYDPGE